ncbi:MAG TPA: glyoxylate/hydroxypyruvate reductase A [Arenimonas sp.]|nr:glyoxylate/hydroxypyruvate reductase A [Arenimonas sp.]HPW33504.1 glyoxylate/hydroxypyruvate reductase A [Arenimonas sp.]
MKILLQVAKESLAWSQALSKWLPEAQIFSGKGVASCDYAVVWHPPAQAFEGQTKLNAIFSVGAGVDGLLSMASLPQHVPLIRMEDVGMADQMAEYALYIALRHLRQINKYEQDQRAIRWDPQAFRPRSSLRIGVLGLGTLGGRVAQVLAEFGFKVSGWSRSPKNLPGIQCFHEASGLDRLLAMVDILFVMLPLTLETTNLLDEVRLSLLPAGSTLVNLSRGKIVSESALISALDSGVLAQAFLDVFAVEPLSPDHTFWKRTDIHITPHVAALTPPDAAAEQVASKIRAMIAGQPVTGTVRRKFGY